MSMFGQQITPADGGLAAIADGVTLQVTALRDGDRLQRRITARILKSYLDYYHTSITHLSLEKDSPEATSVQPPQMGPIVAIPKVGGLHHRYERRAA
jgi:hypothetical protein